MEAEFSRKRKSSFDAAVSNHQDYTPQFLDFDFEDAPERKKVENQDVEEEIVGKNKSNVDVFMVCSNSSTNTTDNKLNSIASFVQSPESDSNSTIPFEWENASPSSVHKEVDSELIDLEAVVRENVGGTACFENNLVPVSEEALLSHNSELSEPPGNFTFINLGYAPASVTKGSVSSDVDVVVEKTPLPCVKNGESSDSANSPDRDTFSPPPPVLSPCNDYINKSGILIPSVIGSTESGRVVVDLPGNFCSTVFTDHDYAILPKSLTANHMPCLPLSSSQVSCNENSSLLQSVAIREREEYIPLDVGTDELDKKELELRKAASGIKEILTPISVETKRLADERELLKSKMTELHADISVRKEVIDNLNQSFANNQENIARFLEERNRQIASTVELNVKLVKTELKLRELQVMICQEKLKVVRGDANAVDSIRSAIAKSEERIVAINADIGEIYKEEKRAKKALMLVEEQLKKYVEEDQSMRRRIDELRLQKRKAEDVLSENERSLEELTSKQKLLIKQRKHYSICFVNLERMMVKIKMCRKLKELDSKEEALKDNEAYPQNRVCPERVNSTSNVQYSRQVTVFGGNYRPSLNEKPTTSGGTSFQPFHHYTSLQSIAIHNGSWIPRPFIPLQHFPPGFLHVKSMVPPWSEPHIHQNP